MGEKKQQVTRPLVSIGLPVYNGENYLSEAIASIVNQSFTDFELLISDNASTDKTAEICQYWAKKDARIQYIRNSKNLGAIPNFNHLVAKARGKYFKWAAHDDKLTVDYLAKCVAILEKDASIVLCCTQVQIIDEFNQQIIPYTHYFKDISASSTGKRFRALIYHDLDCYEIFGLIRRGVLLKTQLFGSYVASDRILRAEIGLYGQFHEIPERLFLSRDHAHRSIRAMPAHHQRAAWFNPKNANRKILPHWRILREYIRCIQVTPLSLTEKIQCNRYILGWLFQHKNWAWLLLDFVLYFYPDAWQLFFRWRKKSWWKGVVKA
ncbi:MAG: glycosyltransferase [Bacteroidota bacterium]